jgi:2-polyprenyl-3-methyl-5-hydroxy-6-metoxy-1,4-benzoquinol methylase
MWMSRAVDLAELMDAPDADPDALRRTYERFALVNRMVARWDSTYVEHVRPLFKPGQTIRILDVGCGAGDVALHLRTRCLIDGFDPQITLIDPSDQVDAYFKTHPLPDGVRYLRTDTSELVRTGATFDLVISNHLLHHLTETEVVQVMEDSLRLCTRRVLFSDLDRNVISWAFFAVFAWPFSFGTFIHTDGLRSIRRSYLRQELIDLLPGGWSVQRQFPFRLLVMRDADR